MRPKELGYPVGNNSKEKVDSRLRGNDKEDKEKVLLCWSGGKDSALALWEIEQSGQYEISALLSTVTADYDRISMHGVRRGLLERLSATRFRYQWLRIG